MNENEQYNVTNVLTDGDTFLNRWVVLKMLKRADIYISLSSYMLAEALLDESIRVLEKKAPESKDEYCNIHRELIWLYANLEVKRRMEEFAKTTETTIFGPLILTRDRTIRLCIFKDIQLSGEAAKGINLITSETIAYAQYMYNKNKDFVFASISDEIFDVCKKFDAPFDLRDLRV